jgi:hypothetical protein
MPADAIKKTNLVEMLEGASKKLHEMSNAPSGWWNHVFSESINWDGDRFGMALTGFFYKASQTNTKMWEFCPTGYKFKDKDTRPQAELAKELTDEFKALGLPEIYQGKYVKDDRRYDVFYSSAETVLNVVLSTSKEDKLITISSASYNEDIINKIKDICLKYLDSSSKTDDLFTVSEGDDGLELVSLGRPGEPLERDNYSKHVIKDFDYISKQFSNKEPFGRLVIIHGPPGTGKTRMLKSFINEIKQEKNKYIFFQPELLSRYNISSITRLLMDAVDDYSAITIFIEDADDVLVPRQSDNMTAISTLLNFADGFIGNMLNLRIIATTNAAKPDIDEALKRAGRLCRIVDVSYLESEHVNRIFERLTGKPGKFDEKMALADVYAEAYKENGTAELLDDTALSTAVGFGKR